MFWTGLRVLAKILAAFCSNSATCNKVDVLLIDSASTFSLNFP
jgi:hypothetical protein